MDYNKRTWMFFQAGLNKTIQQNPDKKTHNLPTQLNLRWVYDQFKYFFSKYKQSRKEDVSK